MSGNQPVSRPSIALLGHSFVHGTFQHFSHQSPLSGQQISCRMRLSPLISEFHMFGLPGAMVTAHNFTLPGHLLTPASPDFAILDFGSNDIVQSIDPLHIATTIYDLANELVANYGVKKVAVCSIIPRYSGLRGMTASQFYRRAYKVNQFLKVKCDGDPVIIYHTHQGFWTPQHNIWSRDGIHPNTPKGRHLYITSMRRAVFKILPRTH